MILLFKFLLVTVFELVYMALKTINITKIVEGNALDAALLGGFMTFIWLVSTAIGIGAILEGNIIIAIGYVIGSMAGCYIGVEYENHRKESHKKEEDEDK